MGDPIILRTSDFDIPVEMASNCASLTLLPCCKSSLCASGSHSVQALRATTQLAMSANVESFLNVVQMQVVLSIINVFKWCCLLKGGNITVSDHDNQ